MDRRIALLVLAAACGCAEGRIRAPSSEETAALDDLEERTFRFFWETTNPENGLVPDRWPTPSFSSIAAVGFGLTAYGVGVERGYVTREAARARTLATLRFFHGAPQGPDAAGMTGYRGFYYHFLDMKTGQRFKTVELSTVDTALLLGGALFAQSYFDRADPEEVEIRDLADELYRRADWTWVQARPPAISMGWTPEGGLHDYDWVGYNEAMLVLVLALGSPTFPADAGTWKTFTAGYEKHQSWGASFGGPEHLRFPPLFGHQYSHVWIDFRGIQDEYMRGKGIDYFENSRRATAWQRAYANQNPEGWKGYGGDVWGLTACDGPADRQLTDAAGRARTFKSYAARGPGQLDDGTLAPTAAASSIAFAPELAIPAIVELRRRYGEQIYSTYGFLDAFNPSYEYPGPLSGGRVAQGFGWVDVDYLGIDQGPIVAMLENYRTGLVWKVMKKSPYLRTGLQRAGFTGGWLSP
ncbi:MAG TPA: glucoamylase family protein [Myxococcaceae bacterium]